MLSLLFVYQSQHRSLVSRSRKHYLSEHHAELSTNIEKRGHAHYAQSQFQKCYFAVLPSLNLNGRQRVLMKCDPASRRVQHGQNTLRMKDYSFHEDTFRPRGFVMVSIASVYSIQGTALVIKTDKRDWLVIRSTSKLRAFLARSEIGKSTECTLHNPTRAVSMAIQIFSAEPSPRAFVIPSATTFESYGLVFMEERCAYVSETKRSFEACNVAIVSVGFSIPILTMSYANLQSVLCEIERAMVPLQFGENNASTCNIGLELIYKCSQGGCFSLFGIGNQRGPYLRRSGFYTYSPTLVFLSTALVRLRHVQTSNSDVGASPAWDYPLLNCKSPTVLLHLGKSEEVIVENLDRLLAKGQKKVRVEETKIHLSSRPGPFISPLYEEPAPRTAPKASTNETQAISDGGLKAWLQVLGAFFISFITWIIINTFGAYQTYFETKKLASSSNISRIGSVQSSLLLILGLVTGTLYDDGYFYALLYSGSFMIILGQMMTSLCNEYYQALLAQGFCIGIGVGLIFIPSVAVLCTYFSSRLTLANGIAAAGSGFGPLSVFKVRVIPSSKRKPMNLSAFKEPAYSIFVLGVGPFNIISLCTIIYEALMFALVNLSGVAGNLVGTPVAGVILQNKDFNSMWIFGGIMSISKGWTTMTLLALPSCANNRLNHMAKLAKRKVISFTHRPHPGTQRIGLTLRNLCIERDNLPCDIHQDDDFIQPFPPIGFYQKYCSKAKCGTVTPHHMSFGGPAARAQPVLNDKARSGTRCLNFAMSSFFSAPVFIMRGCISNVCKPLSSIDEASCMTVTTCASLIPASFHECRVIDYQCNFQLFGTTALNEEGRADPSTRAIESSDLYKKETKMLSMTDYKIEDSLLVGFTKRLIAMNGRSHSPSNSQTSSPLSRRDQRKLARLHGREVVSQDSDEQADLSDAGKIPRQPICRIIDLIQFLSSYDNDVGKIERALASLKERDQKIRSLSTTIRELKRSNNEEVRGLQAKAEEASHSLRELEQQKAVLKENQEQLERQRKQEKARQTSFIQEQQIKFEKRLEEEKDKLVKANAQHFERAKKENATLKENIDTLREEKAQIEKTLKLYVQNSNDLESQMDELKSRYSAQSLPIEQYEKGFSRLREKIQAITQNFLSNLPPDNELKDIEETQKEFSHLNSIFGTISLSASVTSKFLRVRGAQCTIVEAICSRFWQPFYITAKPLSSETTATLSQISQALSEEDRHKESLWRYLSFKGLEIPNSPQDIHAEITGIMEVLRRLIPVKEHRAFEVELKDLLLDSISIWNELKRDSCVVEFDLRPPLFCGPDWVAEDSPELEQIGVKVNDESGDKSKMQQPWCLFPKIVFHPVDSKKKIIPGHAIFVDSLAFHESCDEMRRQEEEIAQVRKNLVRRPTIRRGNGPLST
ncbi:monocarboxylate permease, putative [Talaromyces stipitatus ATCC 10500]|uniref:Monocarboxylate permease, putative n=1 Tax=Talaromyces stipitatus (strain ATCC 10500 / CBS 375.48 / QM 6759 / NRRL 1006) TaxID=441959 RepID=B8LZY1_TALSN|nr:monocarboxylate permease, putative [Talaromyces stipitatus ATCC 10500]EED20913.1 monocarboxylate permease, putative [Talaromyces stipitatus ATCC 10500]